MFKFQKVKPPILYFHSVAPQIKLDWVRSQLTLELDYFEDVLRMIVKNGWKTFFISQIDEPQFTVRNSIGISLDDGYLDNWVYVYPLLKQYGVKATIFCSVDYFDKRDIRRPNADDVKEGPANGKPLTDWGFISVPEMLEMERSGLVEIQCHTLTHDKLPVSEKITGFHHPKNRNINFYFPEHRNSKPDYIGDPQILKSIPYGRPLFEERSAVLSPRVWIEEAYIEEMISATEHYDWSQYKFEEVMELTTPVRKKYSGGRAIARRETQEEYLHRLRMELYESKEVFETILNREVSVLCWPHGDFNKQAFQMAREAGYKHIHYVPTKSNGVEPAADQFTRIGVSSVKNNRLLTSWSVKAKVMDYIGKEPFQSVFSVYRSLKKISS